MTETLTRALKWTLAAHHFPSEDGLERTLEFSPPWSAWVTLLLLLGAAFYIAAIYLRERPLRFSLFGVTLPLTLIRFLLVAARYALVLILLFMLYECALRPYRTDRPELAVLVDISQSMAHRDQIIEGKQSRAWIQRAVDAGFEKPSRLDLAKTFFLERDGQRLRQLADNYKLKVYFAGDSLRPVDIDQADLRNVLRDTDASDHSSRLGDNLHSVLQSQRGRSAAGVVMLSDGVTTEGLAIRDAAAYATQRHTPLFLVGLGSHQNPPDVIVSDMLADDVVFVHDILYFDVKVTAHGYEGREAEMQLRMQGRNEPLSQKMFRLDSDSASQRVRIPFQPTKKGNYEFVIESVPLVGEVTQENNRLTANVSVRDDKINVLLVQAYPNYEFRYLKNVLSRAEDSISLTTVLQDADFDYASVEDTAQRVVPLSRDELFRYDVLILGDADPAQLSATTQQNINDFVKDKGGGMIMVAGPKHTPSAYRDTPLADLFPMNLNTITVPRESDLREEGFRMRPTHLGLATPPLQLSSNPTESLQIWRNLPRLIWLLEASQWKPSVRVLTEHPHKTGYDGRNLPVILMHYVGAGKVVSHMTDETWRWRYRVGDVFFTRYWLQTVRYLSRSKLWGRDRAAELTTDRKIYQKGDAANFRIRFLDDRQAPSQDDGVSLVVKRHRGRQRQVQLHRSNRSRGVFEAVVTQLPEGKYHAWMTTPSLEGDAPSADFEIHSPLGEFARLAINADEMRQAAELSRGRFYTLANMERVLHDLPAGKSVRIESYGRHTLWNSWIIASLFVVILTGEWLLRKRAGLW